MPLSPTFPLYCMEGRVQLPLLKDPLSFLPNLQTNMSSHTTQKFRKNIQLYNSIFFFTSTASRVDSKINDGYDPYRYRPSGQNYNKIGSLILLLGNKPIFVQLYTHDTDNKANNKIGCFKSDKENINREIIDGFIEDTQSK